MANVPRHMIPCRYAILYRLIVRTSVVAIAVVAVTVVVIVVTLVEVVRVLIATYISINRSVRFNRTFCFFILFYFFHPER